VHSSLSEVRKPTVRDLGVRVDRNQAGSLVLLITDEVTPQEVEGSLRKRNDSYKLLLQVVWDGVETYHALAKNDSARVEADDAVHVSRDVKLT